MIKKTVAALLICCLLIPCALAEEWICPGCGNTAEGKFCSNCGTPAPDGEWLCTVCGNRADGKFCSECGSPRPEEAIYTAGETETGSVNVTVVCEENLMFSTYDVELWVDDLLITTIPHGKTYTGVLSLENGKHKVAFYESGSKTVKGSTAFVVEGDSVFRCDIACKFDRIQISNIESYTEKQNEDGRAKLLITVICERNEFFSTYNVEMYLDNEKVGIIPHGKYIEATAAVTPGNHTVVFYKEDDHTVKGIVNISVLNDASFSCTVKCKSGQVEIHNITLR